MTDRIVSGAYIPCAYRVKPLGVGHIHRRACHHFRAYQSPRTFAASGLRLLLVGCALFLFLCLILLSPP